MSGNSVIASARNEMAPTSVRMIARTLAKIGRSTKKCENRIVTHHPRAKHRLFRSSLDLAVLGRDLLPRTGALYAVDHDAVGRREARTDNAQAVDDGAELDLFGADGAVIGNREHDLARLIRRDHVVGYQEGFALAAVETQPPEKARRQQSVLVVEDGAPANRAGLRVDDVVDEIHPALMLEVGFVRETDRDGIRRVAGRWRTPEAASRR